MSFRNYKPGDISKEFWEKAIQFHGTFHGLKITNWIKQREDSRNIKKDCKRSLKTIFDIIECNSKKNKTTELWFARYHIYAGENHSQGTQVKDRKDRKEVAYVTIGNTAFCLIFYLTDIHFPSNLQNVGHVSEQKIKFRPIRTREIAGVRL